MPNRSKQKGDRAERAVVEFLRSYGFEAYRVPLSGSANGFKSDIELRLANQVLKLESKVQSTGFSRIYKWLEKSDLAILKADRKPALAVISLEHLANLIAQIPSKPTQSVTSKPSSDPYLEAYSNESEPVTITKSVDRDLLDVVGVSVNQARLSPLRVATEDDLRRRDEELEADRARYR